MKTIKFDIDPCYSKITNICPPNISPLITNIIFPPNISPPKISHPRNKVKGEFQAQLLSLSKTNIYFNSSKIFGRF